MKKIDQVSQADLFQNENKLAIMAVQHSLLQAARRFISGVAGKVLPSDVVLIAEAEINRASVQGFIQTVRPLASNFVAAGMSNSFWDIVDACNFYNDATDASWPYMSTENRSRSLKWAADHASLV